MLSPFLATLLLAVQAISVPNPVVDNTPPWTIRPANPVYLTWSVGVQGGAVAMQNVNGTPTVTREGGVEHFAQAACTLHDSFSSAREEPTPPSAHLALVITDMPGQVLATFTVRGLVNPDLRPARGEATSFVDFWMPPAHEIGGVVEAIPSVGSFSTRSGVPTLKFQAISTPEHPAPPWHLGKNTVTPAPGVTVTTYFVSAGP